MKIKGKGRACSAPASAEQASMIASAAHRNPASPQHGVLQGRAGSPGCCAAPAPAPAPTAPARRPNSAAAAGAHSCGAAAAASAQAANQGAAGAASQAGAGASASPPQLAACARVRAGPARHARKHQAGRAAAKRMPGRRSPGFSHGLCALHVAMQLRRPGAS